MTPPAIDREQAYRLYFTELPAPTAPSEEAAGLTMRMRLGIPVFAAPLAPSQPELRIVDATYDENGLRVSVYNSGNAHVRLSDISASELADAERSANRRYILAGAVQEFSITTSGGTEISTIQAVTDQLGTIEYDLETGLAVVPADAELASR